MQSQSDVTESPFRSLIEHNTDRSTTFRQQLEFLNIIGKRFVAAFDRFQVHHALLATLQELYHFSACSILLKGDSNGKSFELSIIPCYPLSELFLHAMIEKIARAAEVIAFPRITSEDLALIADLDAPDELAFATYSSTKSATEIGDSLSIPLTVENRIIGVLSLFDEHENAFDTELLQLTTMIADYAAVALENVRLRERETALWQQAELERQRLELIIGSMAEGLLITNARGEIISLNSSAQLLLSQTLALVEQEMPVPLRSLAAEMKVSWLSDLANVIDQALSGKIVKNREVVAGANSETVPLTLSISAAPLYEANQSQTRLVGAVAVLNDVTSIRQIEKLKDEFVSIVSHELRTPLTAIKGYTQHLIRRIERRARDTRKMQPIAQPQAAETPETYDVRSLNIVQSQTEHLERLVNDLLDLSRVQWGDLPLQYSSFYLADVLTECARQAQIGTEQHTIELEIDAHDSKIVADRSRIGQVVGNILDNAIKFSPQGKQVVVTLQEQGNEYLVSVRDQGVGVSADHFDHIFERFYRVRNAASRQYSGIGMGLYVAKAIVEAHGGRIWLTNNQGSGSTFSFTLPRVPRTTPLQLP